ncbi:MAG: hypothetical protein ACKO01_05900 [Erythrobacter sp.]
MNEIVGIAPDELSEYRAAVAGLEGMTDAEKDEAIRIVESIMAAHARAAWGLDPTDLAIENKAVASSQKGPENGTMQAHGQAMLVDLSPEGAITKQNKPEIAP